MWVPVSCSYKCLSSCPGWEVWVGGGEGCLRGDPLPHSSEHPRRAVAVVPDTPCVQELCGAPRVICFPAGFQTWKISAASPPASLSNVACGMAKSSLFSHYKIREELSLSAQGKACRCSQTLMVYPERQESVEESTWANGVCILHVKMFAVLWQDS